MLRRSVVVLSLAAFAVAVVSFMLVMRGGNQSEANFASAAPIAKHVAVSPEKEDRSIGVSDVKVSDGGTYVTFTNGMKAFVSNGTTGAELLKVGLNVNVSYVETDGLPQVQHITAAITPPGCSC